MKTHIKNLFLVPVLTASLGLMLVNPATAQTYNVLKEFTGSDGWAPYGKLTLSSDGMLYGTCGVGGSSDKGVVFKIHTNGTDFAIVKDFDDSDGTYPLGGVVLSGSTLYGATSDGGSFSYGTVFKVNTDGTGYTVLKSFNDTDGRDPFAGVIVSGGALYGTTQLGGSSGGGTLFKINTDGTGFTTLRNFAGGSGDGGAPQADLLLSGATLYGTTRFGGSSDNGTVFKINTNGTGFAVLKEFSGSDGQNPFAGLTLSGATLYGTTFFGGSSGNGVIFKINTNGTGFTVLKEFAGGSDGAISTSVLELSGDTLYGTTVSGGSSGVGTIFKINTNGSGYTVLKHCVSSDGTRPNAGMILSGSMLYGVMREGGSSDKGLVFKFEPLCSLITLTPSLPSGTAGTLYSQTITPTGGTAPYTFDAIFSTPTLGLSFSGGTLSDTPTGPGSISFTLTVTDTTGCSVIKNYTVLICSAITLDPTSLSPGTVGTPYSQAITPSGGTAPYTLDAIFSTPTLGLSFSGGTLSGPPTGAGSVSFTVTATDANGCMGSLGYNLTVQKFSLVAAKDDVVPTSPAGAKFSTFGVPARNNSGNVAFKATLKNGGGVTAANNATIYAGAIGAEALIVRSGDFAPDASGTPTTDKFKSISDPAYNNAGEVAFRSALKTGGGVTAANDTGLWSNAGGTMHLVAREGDVAPDTGGATFASFTSFALPDTGDVVFLGKLLIAGPVTTSNNVGIWVYDSSGNLHLLTRTGDSVVINSTTKILKTLTFLSSVPYSFGQSRSVNNAGGKLICEATFTDGSTAILSANY